MKPYRITSMIDERTIRHLPDGTIIRLYVIPRHHCTIPPLQCWMDDNLNPYSPRFEDIDEALKFPDDHELEPWPPTHATGFLKNIVYST